MNYSNLKHTYIYDYLENSARVKNASKETLKVFSSDLQLFFRFMLIHKEFVPSFRKIKDPYEKLNSVDLQVLNNHIITSITWNDINAYLLFSEKELRNIDNTLRRKLSVIKSFYAYLVLNSFIDTTPAIDYTIKVQSKLPLYVMPEDIPKLVQASFAVNAQYKERNHLILQLILDCGLRVSELHKLNLHDVRGNEIILNRKGNKQGYQFLNSLTMKALEDYYPTRPSAMKIKEGHKDALFISRQYKRLSIRMIQEIIYDIFYTAGLNTKKTKNFSVHKLRHTYATLMSEYVNPFDLRDLLGHSSVKTTDRYAHTSKNKLKEIATKLSVVDIGNREYKKANKEFLD